MLDIISESINKNKELDIRNGELQLYSPSYWERFKNLFSSDYRAKEVAAYFSKNKQKLYKEAEEWVKGGHQLAGIQEKIDSIFKAANTGEPVDLFAHIYSNWVAYLPNRNKENAITLRDILMPATHDSAAYKVNWSVQPKADQENYLDYFFKVFSHYAPALADYTIAGWTITQNESVYKQLSHGTRMLDLRIAYDENSKEFYTTHTFSLMPLKEIFADIRSFSDEHPKEPIIVNMKNDHIYNNSVKARNEELINLVDQYIGDKLNRRITSPINKIQESGKPIFLIYESTTNSSDNGILANINYKKSLTDWRHNYSVENTWATANQAMEEGVFDSYLVNSLSYNISPNASTIVYNFSTDLKKLASQLNSRYDQFIESHSEKMADHLSAIYFDFPTYNMYEKTINLNGLDFNNFN